MSTSLLEDIRARTLAVWAENGLLEEPIAVRARTLSVEEALGNPEGDDFPLQKGKERLMEAEFRGARGQAFTDRFGDFTGTLGDVARMPLANNFRRAVFIAACNATLRSLGLCDRTIHCRDSGPGECAGLLRDHLLERFPGARITQVGYQPKIVQALAGSFDLRVLDLDPDNVGQPRHGVRIDGPNTAREALGRADLLLVTGSTLANDSLGDFLLGKPVILYGTTIAGPAALMGWERFCARSE
ncbi:DUF364 domain-containing protein [Desulfovibrio aminophilus]|nr:DUF364 domain-containing protein [Desulfovibrio aminophilus]MCM0756449.1 DUF364 domain-containing protein [Desulfovibrio aminophilus]